MVSRKGAWYSYEGDNIAQGRDNAVRYLEENPELALIVEQKVKENLDINNVNFAGSNSSDYDSEE